MKELSTDRFTWTAGARAFVVDRSHLGRLVLGEEFRLVSHRTGLKILCRAGGQKRDGEGELVYDRYLCYDLNGRPLSGPLAGAEVLIFNT